MKIGFVSPYWKTLGGGERYLLTIASYWSKTNEVRLLVDEAGFLESVKDRLAIDVSRISTTRNFFLGRNILTKAVESRFYDLLFFVTDGSLPTTLARRNFLHIQVPFAKIPEPDWKFGLFERAICNSKFTKENLDERLGKRAIVIYPPVDTRRIKELEKKPIILSVGRFSQHYRAKKHEVLISAFKKLRKDKRFSEWQLVIAGGLLPSDEDYFEELKRTAEEGVVLLPNVSNKDLNKLYGVATVYWHAAGYGENDPMKMEHFGISIVEAMSGGGIPVVYNGGGLPEIVNDGINGLLWMDEAELINKTRELLSGKQSGAMKIEALKTVKKFSSERFNKEVDELI